MAPLLADYCHDLGYTHVELMPITEHPFDGSWGYQTVGYFAPTSRFGTPQDFMFLVDALHRRGLGVILDWVPAHFPRDEHGLGYFDGTHLYEHADPNLREHKDWGTLIYNYGRNEVSSFLISNALFWLDRYHIDGLRVDAVASMLYLDYSREPGQWTPNYYGGRENLEAIAFLRRLNERVYADFPDVVTIAEESTAWPQVSRPVHLGGLGFGYKWDMGWMHDSLEYLSQDPVHRKYHHNALTFRAVYAFAENYVLPLSHDEVVHGKRSLVSKMPGDEWQKFANLRLLFGWQYLQPGKKLLFMGGEFGQWREWNHDASLDWHLLEQPLHHGAQRWVRDLNTFYRGEPALHERDCDAAGFEWVDCRDSETSVVSLLRKGKDPDDCVLAVFNFTPVVRVWLSGRRTARRPLGRGPQQRRAAVRRQRPGQPRRRRGGADFPSRPRFHADDRAAAAGGGGVQVAARGAASDRRTPGRRAERGEPGMTQPARSKEGNRPGCVSRNTPRPLRTPPRFDGESLAAGGAVPTPLPAPRRAHGVRP